MWNVLRWIYWFSAIVNTGLFFAWIGTDLSGHVTSIVINGVAATWSWLWLYYNRKANV